MKTKIDALAEAAYHYDGLRVRSLVQELLREGERLADVPRPQTDNLHLLAIAASLIELLAARLGQEPPSWTQEIGPLPEPYFLLKSATQMKRLRELCRTHSPEGKGSHGGIFGEGTERRRAAPRDKPPHG